MIDIEIDVDDEQTRTLWASLGDLAGRLPGDWVLKRSGVAGSWARRPASAVDRGWRRMRVGAVGGSMEGMDINKLPAPAEGLVVTQFLAVRDVARSRDFYVDVLGGEVVVEEDPCIVRLANSWLIMNPGGGPTADKPGVTIVEHEVGDEVSSFLNLRVADVAASYETWKARGAEFLTPPIDRGAEIRCYMRDPDGYLIEVGQSTGLLDRT